MTVLDPIQPLMPKYGVNCSPEEFQRAVNLAFHRAESEVYDRIHHCMRRSLPEQFNLLIDDALRAAPSPGDGLVVLDVGCGTGLSSELLLRTRIGAHISEIHLLDTSVAMLAKARNRSRRWPVKTVTVEGGIERLIKEQRKYDAVLVCSVLHHIPDLASFFRDVRGVQTRSGLLIHLQDPNGDYLADAVLNERIDELARHSAPALTRRPGRFHPKRALAKLRRMVTERTPHDYIRKVNNELLALGIIGTPMTDNDIWRVTDIHDHDGRGISIEEMRSFLPDHELISARSYSFFGAMASDLPPTFRQREQELIRARALNGLRIAGLWRVRSDS
jgi:ubiquinone/menaquinone biosynthesis C-methylase UbiE